MMPASLHIQKVQMTTPDYIPTAAPKPAPPKPATTMLWALCPACGHRWLMGPGHRPTGPDRCEHCTECAELKNEHAS